MPSVCYVFLENRGAGRLRFKGDRNCQVWSMSARDWNYFGRKPRHVVSDASLIAARLAPLHGDAASTLNVELIDFARGGARLRAADPGIGWLAEGAASILQIRSIKPGIDIQLPGRIRWQQAEGPGQWLIGCEFDAEVPLETLGELFLNDILSASHLAPADESPLAVEPPRPQG